MWRFRARLQIDVNSREQHPLSVRRDFGLLDALERHHVFEGEGVFLGLSEGKKSENSQTESYCGAHEASSQTERV